MYSFSFAYSQCNTFDLTLSYIGLTNDGHQFDLVLGSAPPDIIGLDILIEITNSNDVIINEAATENSIHSTFSNYDIDFVFGGNVEIDDSDIFNPINLSSSITLFSIFLHLPGEICTNVTINSGARILIDEGNSNTFCEQKNIINPSQLCAPALNVSGEIVTVPVQCNGASNYGLLDASIEGEATNINFPVETTDTENDGDYILSGLINSGDYSFTPSKDPTNAANDCGLNTFDIDKIRDFIIDPSDYTEIWEWIASDANNSGAVSNFDMIVIQRTINGTTPQVYQSWDFATNYTTLTVPSTTSVPAFTNNFTLNNLTASNTGNDIIGVKIGDAFASCTTCTTSLDEPESPFIKSAPKTFLIGNVIASEGQTIRIPVYATEFNNQTIFSLGIDLSPNYFEVLDVEAGKLPTFDDADYSVNIAREGEVSVLWFHENRGGITLSVNDPLFYIVARTKKTIPSLANLFEQRFERHDNIIHTEENEYAPINLALRGLPNQLEQNDQVLSVSAKPNPFSNQLEIEFELPESSLTTIQFFDVNGRVVASYQENFSKGYNSFRACLNFTKG